VLARLGRDRLAIGRHLDDLFLEAAAQKFGMASPAAIIFTNFGYSASQFHSAPVR
jgi:hypothetical protein